MTVMRIWLGLIAFGFGVAFFAAPNPSRPDMVAARLAESTQLSGDCPAAAPVVAPQSTNFPQGTVAIELHLPGPAEFDWLLDDGSESALATVRKAAEANAAAVAGWWSQLPPGAAKTQALEQVTTAWAEADFPGASLWCEQLPAGPDRELAITLLIHEAARSNPQEAIRLAGTLQDRGAGESATSHAFSQWTASAPQAARAWAEALAPGPLREGVLGQLALTLAEQDGASAAALVASELHEGQEQTAAAIGVVQRWAQREPAKAADWVSLFPEGVLMNDAAFELMSTWTATNPDEASRWLELMPAGAFRHACSEALSRLNASVTW